MRLYMRFSMYIDNFILDNNVTCFRVKDISNKEFNIFITH